MDIPDNVLNPVLYRKAKADADIKYARAGLYKSAWIVKRYTELGGNYTGKPSGQGIKRWLDKEDWISVIPYLRDKQIVKCGSADGKLIACRPMVRANDKTPITLPELLKIHSKAKLLDLAKEKENSNKRINWKAGTIS
jgi:hypothetical protein